MEAHHVAADAALDGLASDQERQQVVAEGADERIGRGAHAGQPVGVAQDALAGPVAVVGVSLEAATHHTAGELGRVLDAEVHAPAARGRVDMGGVAGKEGAALGITLDETVIDGELRHPQAVEDLAAGRQALGGGARRVRAVAMR